MVNMTKTNNQKRVIIIQGDTGSGKSALANKTAIYECELGNFQRIVSNYHVISKFPNIFSEYFLLPFSTVKRAVTIVDDIGALEEISIKIPEKLLIFFMNTIRKRNSMTVLTGQDYTYFPAKMRRRAKIIILELSEKYPLYVDNVGLIVKGDIYHETKKEGLIYDRTRKFVIENSWGRFK